MERAHVVIRGLTPMPRSHHPPQHQLTTLSYSKEDEEILKAEYLKNPKPDKAARMDIVGKVALGEKEVQVRFASGLHVTSVRD